jgi:hypothetical protein
MYEYIHNGEVVPLYAYANIIHLPILPRNYKLSASRIIGHDPEKSSTHPSSLQNVNVTLPPPQSFK